MSASTEILSRRLTILLAISAGVVVANLYYAQPLAIPMAADLGLDAAIAGLLVTVTQAGYALGVLILAPLADLLENRRVILTLIVVTILALFAVGFTANPVVYLLSAFLLGVGVSCLHIIVPYATHLSPPEIRGQVVGSLMSGVMFGIMVSRPIAGFLLYFISWHAVYFFSAAAMTLIGAILAFTLPARQPTAGDLRYRRLLVSMVKLPVHYSILRRRAIYQGSIFFAFCLFWTTVPILLAGPGFNMSQSGIAQFALVGVTGAVFAPIFGRLADRGFTNQATTFSFLAGAGSFVLTRFVPLGSSASLVLLTLAAILLDAAVSGNLVVGQRAIFTLPAELRGRLNSLYVTTIFTGGALGSFVGAWAYSRGGWNLTSMIGGAMPTLGFVYFVTEFFRKTIVSSKDSAEKRST